MQNQVSLLYVLQIGLLTLLQLPALAQGDREALVSLYQSANGDSWLNRAGWKDEPRLADGFNDSPCSEPVWFGITCEEGRVSEVRLNSNNLSGTLPSTLPDLSQLQTLNLSRNSLSGPIPAGLSSLSQLAILDLSVNRLSGFIGAELGDLSNLTCLDLGFNQLRGPIPSQLGKLSQLRVLELAGNQLGGAIPAQLGDLSQLSVLNLGGDQLSGAIPVELSNLSQLTVLNLAFNQLSGAIPAELANLSLLRSLTLPDNRLSGPIPAELGRLSQLQVLLLSDNQLSASIPAQLGDLSQLRSLVLSSNQLNGSIPAQLGALSQLGDLDMSMNHLSGPIPAQLGNLSQLRFLDLSLNQLSGSVPAQLGNLPVTRLDLHKNQLSGIVPAEIANLPAGILDLRCNRLESVEGGLSDQLDVAQRGEARWDSLQNVVAVYPQLALGGGVEVVLMISNASNLPWRGRAYLDGGRWPLDRAWRLDGTERTGESSFPLFLSPSATRKLILSSPSESPDSGWLSLRSEGGSRPQDGIAAFFFNLSGESGLSDSTGVGKSEFATLFRMPVEQSSTVSTGVAVRSVAARVTFILFGAGGQFIEGVRFEQDQALLLNELFPDLPADFVGQLEIFSGSPFFVTVIRVEQTEASSLQLTSIPATPTRFD